MCSGARHALLSTRRSASPVVAALFDASAQTGQGRLTGIITDAQHAVLSGGVSDDGSTYSGLSVTANPSLEGAPHRDAQRPRGPHVVLG